MTFGKFIVVLFLGLCVCSLFYVAGSFVKKDDALLAANAQNRQLEIQSDSNTLLKNRDELKEELQSLKMHNALRVFNGGTNIVNSSVRSSNSRQNKTRPLNANDVSQSRLASLRMSAWEAEYIAQ